MAADLKDICVVLVALLLGVALWTVAGQLEDLRVIEHNLALDLKAVERSGVFYSSGAEACKYIDYTSNDWEIFMPKRGKDASVTLLHTGGMVVCWRR